MIKGILDTGTSEDNQEDLNNRIRLSNFIALFIILVSICTVPFYVHFNLYLLTSTSAAIILISILSIYLQSVNKYLPGFSLLTFGSALLFIIVSLYFGLIINM